MNVCGEKHEESTKKSATNKQLEKEHRTKVKQKSIGSLYISNEQLQLETYKNSNYIISFLPKGKQILRYKPNKIGTDSICRNYKILVREIKGDLNKWVSHLHGLED